MFTTSGLLETKVVGITTPDMADILSNAALEFVARLHKEFNARRLTLLQKRYERQREFDSGILPDFLPETQTIRQGTWRVADIPADLQDRRVEITGPVERKMMINALNSGASVFMADFEDALSPTWENVVHGQRNLIDAVLRKLSFTSPEGKSYTLNEKLATLVVRPRGWHLYEKNFLVEDQPVSASLFDFGLYFFHNAHNLLERGTGPYFYLPKMESHEEARLWNDVFCMAEDVLNIPRGTIKATVLIETIPAAFEMEEILYELRDHMAGLNAGRWDYIFSIIKKFQKQKKFIFPDRVQVTMAVPFMRAYCQLMVKTCHKRGAHAIGGMAAFVPNRKDPQVTENALNKVREDKQREAGDGFDGTWVAHPDLVPVAREQFDAVLGTRPHQKDKLREDVHVQASQLVDFAISGGKITEAGVANNIDAALSYLDNWLRGTGAAAIHNLMEDVATAEIARSQLWQWINHGAKLNDGRAITPALYEEIKKQELAKLGGVSSGRLGDAARLLDQLTLNKDYIEFLTLPAYELLT